MQGQVIRGSLVKILKTCYKNGFFNLKSKKNSLTYIQYGPLGTLLTRNVWQEWLSSITNNTDVSMFPIEVLSTEEKELNNLPIKSPVPFLSEAFKNYLKLLPLIGKHNAFGFGVYGPINDYKQNNLLGEKDLLRKFQSRCGLSIIFFCPLKKSSDWFHYWSRYRYRWWRKFSSIPSMFSLSDVNETKEGNQQICLLMEFPWGKECIETITLYGETSFKNYCHMLNIREKEKTDQSAVIVCESELRLASFAYLSNSFAEKWRNGQTQKLLQLNTKLAPYKISMSVDSDNADEIKQLKEVARHIEKELKNCRIAVFPCFDASPENKNLYSRFDEMGIPYSIIFDKKSVNSGIAGLRSRDTTVKEQVHIAELVPKITKYLQMKSYTDEDS